MKAWFQRFMSGRYGSDTFGNFLCVTALVCLVIGLFVGIFYYIGLLLLLYAYFRMLSRNVHKRYAENIAFMQKTAGVRAKFGQLQQRFALRKTYRYFSCPHCRQQVREPKGRGKISITSPKSGTQLIKKSYRFSLHFDERLTLRVWICYHLSERFRQCRNGLLPGVLLRALPIFGPQIRHGGAHGAEL